MEPMVGQVGLHKDPFRGHAERRRAEATMRLLRCDPTNRILDVGCGVGYQLSFAVLRCAQVVGVDVSSDRLKEGKKRVSKAEFIRASSEKIPLRPGVFDKVLCLELLEHLENPPTTLSEIDFVLKSKGILIVSVPYKEKIILTQCTHCGKLTPLYGHRHSFDEKKISQLLKDYAILRMERMGTVLSLYMIFNSLPDRLWRIIDDISRYAPGISPAWLLSKAQKAK